MWRTSAQPPDAAHTLHLYRLRKGAVFSVVCLSEQIYGITTHWMGGHTEPCIDPADRCPGCQARKPRRWKGYLHARSTRDATDGIIELTAGAARQLIAQKTEGIPLRGLLFRIERSKNASNGRLDVHVLGSHANPETLPPAKSPQQTLELLFSTAAPRSDQNAPVQLPRL